MQGGLQVGGFEVGHFGQNLLGVEAGGEELEYIYHADAHAENAGPAAALARVGGDAGEQGFHVVKILKYHEAASRRGPWGRGCHAERSEALYHVATSGPPANECSTEFSRTCFFPLDRVAA